MAYITGPPPPPAPMKKLVLPGGKLTKKEKPLWLTYRELADNELRKARNELLHDRLSDRRSDARRQRRRDRARRRTSRIDLSAVTQAAVRLLRRASAPSRTATQWTGREGEGRQAATSPARRGDARSPARREPRAHGSAREMAASTSRYAQEARGRQSKWADAAGRVLEGAGPRSEGRARERRARRASLHARQGARGAGQGRRPGLPQGGRAAPRLRAREEPPAARGREPRQADVDAVRAPAPRAASRSRCCSPSAMVRRRA